MQTDRWIEIDLFFFQRELRNQASEVVERLAPLWREVSGDYGIILCCGWLCDLVTEWQGADDQRLPFRSPTAAVWSEKSYSDLRKLVRALKEEGARVGLGDLKVGIMMVAWGTFSWGEGGGYDLQSGWYDRHPEIYFTDNWKNIDYRQRLLKDEYPYASRPAGLAGGESFAEFFAGQWGLVSRFLELDVVHFRDGFLGRAIYEMIGPFGFKGPENPAEGAAWSRELIAFFSAAKQANPSCRVMLYSSARSAVGEYRVGCFDLAALVASGGIDVWIDQTWAGAWQDWWTHEFRGWTFQLANLIAHHVMVVAGNASREAPCRHYHLVETFDAWEPWDTLHQVPDKLRWGIWAFCHAAVATPSGLSRLSGSYISWASNWEAELLSPTDVAFLQANLNAATQNANEMEEVYGPALALNLPQMAAIQQSSPAINAGDLIDDQCAMLMKWAFPCLSGVNLGGAPVVRDGYVLQTPCQLSPGWRQLLRQSDVSYIAAGPAQFIDPELLADIGVVDGGRDFVFGKQKLEFAAFTADERPRISSVMLAPNRELKPGAAEVIAQTNKTVLIAKSPQHAHFLWQAQCPFVPWISYLGQGQYGSLAPFVALARAWQRTSEAITVADVPFHLPVAFHAWKSAGNIFVLVGNLETGITGDSRTSRKLIFTLNKERLQLVGSYLLQGAQIVSPQSENATEVVFCVEIAPQGSDVYQLIPVSQIAGVAPGDRAEPSETAI